jgi:hypothetical protein
MAGLGEYLLDVAAATGDEQYAESAATLAQTILWYSIDKPDGLALPGR